MTTIDRNAPDAEMLEGRLYDWMFLTASKYIDHQPREVRQVVQDLCDLCQDSGWFEGKLADLVGHAVDNLLAQKPEVTSLNNMTWEDFNQACKDKFGYSATTIAVGCLANKLDPDDGPEYKRGDHVNDLANIIGSSGDMNSRSAAQGILLALEKAGLCVHYKEQPIRKNIEVVRCYGGYRCEIHVGKEIFAHATLSFTKEKAEARRQQILSQAIQTTADDLDEADHRARGMQQELADVLGATSPLTWPQLLGLVETLRLQVEHKQKVEHIIETLRGMDTLSDIVDQVRLQLSDEAVVEHLKTCAQALDEQHHKYILMDAAELLTDLFCSEES